MNKLPSILVTLSTLYRHPLILTVPLKYGCSLTKADFGVAFPELMLVTDLLSFIRREGKQDGAWGEVNKIVYSNPNVNLFYSRKAAF